MIAARRDSEGFWRIRSSPRGVRVAWALAAIGVLAAATLLSTPPFAAKELLWFLAAAIVPAVVYLTRSPVYRIDPDRHRIYADGRFTGRDHHALVGITTGVTAIEIGEYPTPPARWWAVTLIPAADEADAAPITLTSTRDELEAWRVAKIVARSLALPLLYAGPETGELRPADAPDMSLSELAAASFEPVPDPGPAPTGLDVEEAPGRLRVRWRAPRPVFFLAAVGIALLAAVGAPLAAWESVSSTWWPPLVLAAAAIVPPLLASRGWGTNELEIVDDALRHTIHRPFRSVSTMRVDALQRVSRFTEPRSEIALLSDETRIRAEIDPISGRWLEAKVHHWLAAEARRARGPGTATVKDAVDPHPS